MPVVTIRGQLESGAPEIGRQVANRLGGDYVDREIIAEVAARLVWSKEAVAAKEMPPSTLLARIGEALARGYTLGGGYQGAYLPTWEIPLDDTSYLVGLESVVKGLASNQSIVIRGRGSQFILKDSPGAFHVLIVAPLELRVKRVMENLKVNEATARKEVTGFDSSHREFTKRYFQAELEDPACYDLVINTQYISFEAATSIIVGALAFKVGP